MSAEKDINITQIFYLLLNEMDGVNRYSWVKHAPRKFRLRHFRTTWPKEYPRQKVDIGDGQGRQGEIDKKEENLMAQRIDKPMGLLASQPL